MTKGRLRFAALMLLLWVSSPASAAGAGQEGSQRETGAWSSHKRWEAGFGADVARGRQPEPIDAVAEAAIFDAITKLEQKLYVDGIAQLQAVARKYPGTDYERVANLWEGIAEVKRNRYGEARALFRKVATSNPTWTQEKLASRWSKTSRRLEAFAEYRRLAGKECGARALAVCFRALGRPNEAEQIEQVTAPREEGFSIKELTELSAEHGQSAWPLRISVEQLAEATPPFVALIGLRQEMPHFVAVTAASSEEVTYVNLRGFREQASLKDFMFDFGGVVITFHERDLRLGAPVAAADASEIRGGHWTEHVADGRCCEDGTGGGGNGNGGGGDRCCNTDGCDDDEKNCKCPADNASAGDNAISPDFYSYSTGPGGGQTGGSLGSGSSGGANRSAGGNSAGGGVRSIPRGGVADGGGLRAAALVQGVGPGLPRTESCSFGTPLLTVSFCDLDLRLKFKPVRYSTGIGPSIEPWVFYNFEDTVSGDFGNGCSWSYGASLSEEPGSGDVSVAWPSGLTSLFTYDSQTESYTPPTGRRDELKKNEDGSFDLYLFWGRQHYIFDADGRLSRIVDGWTKYLDFMRTAGGVLTKVTDASGRGTSMLVDDSNRITRATMPDGRYASYYYDGSGNLSRVVDSAECAYTFYYNGSNYITKLTTPTGDYTFAYQTYADTEHCLTKLTNPQGEVRYYIRQAGGMPFMYVQYGDGTLLEDRRCNCDETGNFFVCEGEDIAYVAAYRDAAGRMTMAYRVGLIGASQVTETFAYDSKGNRTHAVGVHPEN